MDIIFQGISVIAVVMGLVELAKRLGVAGKWSLVLSMCLGVVFGILAQIASAGLPVGFAGWFGTVLMGLVLGLSASGLFDVGKAMALLSNKSPQEPPK